MVNIQVLGKGLIPRGLGIAPRMQPFPADLTLISSIMQTAGLKVRMINPETGKPIDLTPKNVKRLWEKYGNTVPTKNRVVTVNIPEKKEEEPKKEPQIYNPVNQNPNGYKEVPKNMIQESVQSAAASVFGNGTTVPPASTSIDPVKEETASDSKGEKETEIVEDTQVDQEKKEEEPKTDDKKDNSNNGNNPKNNGGKNQPFKPMNNPKQK